MTEAVGVIKEILNWFIGIPEKYFLIAFKIWALVFTFTLGQLTYGIWGDR